MPPKDSDRMANSEDTDQTAPSGAVCSGSAVFAQTHLSQYIAVTSGRNRLNFHDRSSEAVSD